MQKKRNRSTATTGFTLLEVMIAMAIFSIGILAIIGVQYLVVRGNASGNAVTEQLMLARWFMEETKNTIDNELPDLQSATLAGVTSDGQIGGGPYTVEIKVTNPLQSSISRFIRITVTKAGLHGNPVTIRSMTHANGT